MLNRRMPGRRVLSALVAVASAALVAGGAVVLGHAAQAALIDVPAIGDPGRLVLSADPYPAEFFDISPGDPSYWQVAARLEDAARATLSVEFRKSGDLVTHPRGLVMTIDECAEEWVSLDATPVCAPGPRRIAVATPADDNVASSPTFELAPLRIGTEDYLLVTLAVEDSAAAAADTTLMGLRGDIGLGLTAVSIDDVPVTPGGRLPATGFDPLALVAAGIIAAGLLGLGAALRLGRRGGTR